MMLQLEFRSYLDGPDENTAAILALIDGDPIHSRDREAVIEAIRTSVRHDGTVTANDWRGKVPAWVYPRVVGATVASLARRGVLHFTGDWVPSNDTHGRNSGKPTRVYRWQAA